MVNLLLLKGADVNAHRGQFSTLQIASDQGHVRVVQSLLAYGADVNAVFAESVDATALQSACAGGHLEVVKLLLDSGADVNIQGGAFGNALGKASSIGCDRIVQLLLEQGADVNGSATDSCDKVLDAAFIQDGRACHFHHNRENVVLLLMEKCDGLDGQGERYGNLLCKAAAAGFEKVTKRLLTIDVGVIARENEDRGSDVNALAGVYGNALRAASHNGHDKIVQLLLDRGADVNLNDGEYGSALGAASCNGHDNIVQRLLDRGADASAEDGQYGSALEVASRAGHVKIVQMLLQNTINRDVGGTANAAAFDTAFRWGYTDILETLLMSHCKETVADEHGWSSEAYLVLCRGFTSQTPYEAI
ncbi:hypothetical protein E4T50_17070 [Aureobasidium sp. EXF-12298]|nr:hypothetical protein E4T50_17070 [Aureobasidium sp. EXF-12298]KAI4752770.1 hypothetical protein E4T51_14067 [Aureobasidium sp. EXF-12344]KAI4778203.1 hypothetical protein E4T52_06862 [Aureobasidium sp. EXF-3400]